MKLIINIFFFLFILSQSAVSQWGETYTHFNSHFPDVDPAYQNFHLDKQISGENSVNADFYRLSSVVTDNKRFTYNYNNLKLSTKLTEILTNEGTWEIYSRNVYTYDDNGNMLKDLLQRWYDSVWVDRSRYLYTYNSDGKITINLWEELLYGEWINAIRYSYTYNGNKVIIVHDTNPWGAWELYSRTTITYNDSGKPIISLMEEWQSGFVNTFKRSYGYDVNGNLMVVFGENWENNNWVNASRILYSYNSNGYILTIIRENWDNSWHPINKYIYTYDVNGNIYSIVWENRSVYSYKMVYLCNNYGNTIHGERFIWENGIWVIGSGNLDIIYNKMENVERLYGSKWFDASYHIITDVNYNKSQEIEYSLENNYPNPFNPSTKIRYSISEFSSVQIKVFDILGNEIETLLNEEKPGGIYELTWNAAYLPSGVYFYQLKAGDYFSIKKMLLLK